jgi:hypothetical protein
MPEVRIPTRKEVVKLAVIIPTRKDILKLHRLIKAQRECIRTQKVTLPLHQEHHLTQKEEGQKQQILRHIPREVVPPRAENILTLRGHLLSLLLAALTQKEPKLLHTAEILIRKETTPLQLVVNHTRKDIGHKRLVKVPILRDTAERRRMVKHTTHLHMAHSPREHIRKDIKPKPLE